MAALTTQRSGNWTDIVGGTTPWTALTGSGTGGVPGNGDTITIAAGHTVTIPDGAGTIIVGPSYLGSPTAPTYSGSTASTTVPWSGSSVNIAISVIDAGGKESLLSSYQQQFFTANTTKPRLTMPALPSGASSFSVYMNNGSSGTMRRYTTGVAGSATVDLTSANWLAGTVDYNTASVAPQDAIAITIANTGKLVVGAATPAAPPTLVVRGDIFSQQTTGSRTASFYPLTLNPGTVFEFDSSQASNPTSQSYTYVPTGYNQYNNYLNFNGSSGSRVTVRSNASGRNGRFSVNGMTGNMQIQAQYTDFLRIGTSALPSIEVSLGLTGHSASVTNCTFTSCGVFSSYSSIMTASSNFIFTDTIFSSSLETRSLRIRANDDRTTGTREIKRNYFDLFVNDPSFGGSFGGFTIRHNIFGGDLYMDPTINYALFDLNVVRKTATTWPSNPIAGDVSNCFFLADGNVYNPHFMSASASRAATFNGLILQCTGSSTATDGDGIGFSGSAVSVLRYTIKNCLVLPRSGDGVQSSCTLASFASASSRQQTADIQHNTYMGSSAYEHGIQHNETTASVAGMFPLFRSNLYWDSSARGNHFNTALSGQNPPADDVLTASGATNNCAYNASPYSNSGKTSDGTYYGLPLTVGTPGSSDVNTNPAFVDTTRNFEQFATTFGDTASVANTMTRLKVDLANRIPALMLWVRSGFGPSAATLRNAAHDTGVIGAVNFAKTRSLTNLIALRTAIGTRYSISV